MTEKVRGKVVKTALGMGEGYHGKHFLHEGSEVQPLRVASCFFNIVYWVFLVIRVIHAHCGGFGKMPSCGLV